MKYSVGALLLIAALPSPAVAQTSGLGPNAISGTPTSALYCLSSNSANVHNLGWLGAGGGYTITFDASVPLSTAIVRLDLAAQTSTTIRGNPDFNFNASSSGTMALHVSTNGQSGCYRYKAEIDPASPTFNTSRLVEPAATLSSSDGDVPARGGRFSTLAISGAPTSATHCVSGTLRPNVHDLGRADRAVTVTVSFEKDFDAIAGATMIVADAAGGTGSYVIDDDASGLSFQVTAGRHIALFVGGREGSSGCYRYQVQVR